MLIHVTFREIAVPGRPWVSVAPHPALALPRQKFRTRQRVAPVAMTAGAQRQSRSQTPVKLSYLEVVPDGGPVEHHVTNGDDADEGEDQTAQDGQHHVPGDLGNALQPFLGSIRLGVANTK